MTQHTRPVRGITAPPPRPTFLAATLLASGLSLCVLTSLWFVGLLF